MIRLISPPKMNLVLIFFLGICILSFPAVISIRLDQFKQLSRVKSRNLASSSSSAIRSLLFVIPVSDHKWTSSYTLYNTHSEIDYYLRENQIYGSIISPGFEEIHLRVGQVQEATVLNSEGAKDSYVICEYNRKDDAYLDEYEPIIHYYGHPSNAPFGTFIHRQVWDCRTEKLFPPVPEIHFYRIVSVMHGIRPVDTIFYFEGIEVIKSTASTSTGLHSVTFKEVKYIDPNTKKNLFYTGKVYLKKGPGNNPMQQFKPLDIFHETDFKTGKDERDEHLGSIGPNPKSIKISTTGEILKVGKWKFTDLGNKEDKAVCEFQLEEKAGTHYLPYCAILTSMSDKTEYKEFYGVGKVSENYFSVENQELWKCTFETTEDEGKGTNKIQKTFHRKVTEMVGAIPISKFVYYGAVSVWKYKLNSTSSSVRVKEIYYHQDNNINEQIRFNGAVILKKPPEQRVSNQLDTEEKAFLYSYNSTVPSYYPQIIDNMSDETKPVGKRYYFDEKESTAVAWLRWMVNSYKKDNV